MDRFPTVLCPVDYSDESRQALSYAAAIAEHFGARLIVLTVNDPLLANVAATAGYSPSLADESEAEVRRLIAGTIAAGASPAMTIDVRVAVGKPAPEILRTARETAADLIVIGSHGRSGINKRFFGSTAERVLRETEMPVLVTRGHGTFVTSLADAARRLRRIVVPVDLTPASPHQVVIAAGIAAALGVPVILTHVIEPAAMPTLARRTIPGLDAERRSDAETRLHALSAASKYRAAEALVLNGDPAEEIARVAETRDAGLIVMGLHASGLLGPRMGSVTYRVLCLTQALVLALPPVPATSDSEALRRETTHH